MSNAQLVVSGSIAIDRIMNFKGHYRELLEGNKLEVISVSVLVDSLEQARGGIAANITSSLAQLGERPILLGSIGQDAQDYMTDLSKLGVDVSHVHTSQLPTASFNVLTDTSGNQVGGFYPGAMSDADSLTFTKWAGQDVLFCVSAHDPAAMRRQVEECRQHNMRLFYDPGQQVTNVPAEDIQAGVSAAEVLILNEYELSVLTNKTGLDEGQLARQLPVLITTHGEHGSRISGKNYPEAIEISSASPAQIADPTGAGDAYRAGFIYGYLRQWEAVRCGRLGAVIASFVLEQHGTQATLSRQAISKRYQQTYNEEVQL